MIYNALQRELRGATGKRMRDLVALNAELIRSLPLKVSKEVTAKVSKLTLAGERPETIAANLGKLTAHIARWHVQLIARTETSKAMMALTQARAEDLGINYYVWRSSEDSRVRISHRFMAQRGGVLVSWADPPSPELLVGEKSTLGHYNAGDCPNCRCYSEPLLRIDQVKWPHRVYASGQVNMMTLANFRRVANVDRGTQRLGMVA